jgi:hypothetical protein
VITHKKIPIGYIEAKDIDKDFKNKAYQRTNIPAFFTLPQQKGGYLILSEFKKDGSTEILKSRRYIKVGEVDKTKFWEVEP